MSNREQQPAELLDQYWEALRSDVAATPPDELDPEIAIIVKRLERHLRPPDPDDAFAGQLRRRLEVQAANLAATRRGQLSAGPRRRLPLRFGLPRQGWPLVGLAAAAALLLALVGVTLWASRPQPVSAQEILDRAHATATDVEVAGVRSFEMVETTVYRGIWTTVGQTTPRAEETRSERHVWFKAPNHWRYEVTLPPSSGQRPAPMRRVTVADGQTVWTYDSEQNVAQITADELGGPGKGGIWLYGNLNGQSDVALADILKEVRNCYDPIVAGEDLVAGRQTYVVNLGATKCPSASAAETNGPQTIWVDKETFFVLRSEIRDASGQRVISANEVTNIRYDVDLSDEVFTFSPPPGALVHDNRPKPAPSGDEFERQIEAVARQADFPVFVPRQVPAGLVPRSPQMDPQAGLRLEYVPAASAATDAPAQRDGLGIFQRRATYASLARSIEKAETVSVSSGRGWLRRGVRNPDGTGSNSAVIILRDGTLISVASFSVAPEDLVKVAASLESVPGGHSPLPAPTPPALTEIRQRVSFPVFAPTWVPGGLVPQPPIGGEQPRDAVHIPYHTADGTEALHVLNGPAGCCLDADPRKAGQTVVLANGTAAHFLDVQPEYGGPILWWQQEGTYVALSGPHLTRDELVKSADSMSKTADLRAGEPASAPTATAPVASPRSDATVSQAAQRSAAVCALDGFPELTRRTVNRQIEAAVGGGEVQDGPFTFCLILYADPSLRSKSEADHPSRASDIPGIGWTAVWVYQGPGLVGEIPVAYGALPDGVEPRASYRVLEDGEAGGRTGGGVVLPDGAGAGDRVELGINLDTPEGIHGARIAFTLADHGVEQIAVRRWE